MILSSPLSPKAYIYHLKEHMSGHFEFGNERYTGFFLGRYFCVTHHAAYEWNRKYTNQKNCAVGHVRPAETGCEVRFIRFKGALCPPQFLGMLLIMFVLSLFMFLGQAGEFHIGLVAISAAISLGSTLFAAPLATLFESFTHESEEGRKILIALLMTPDDPFPYLRNKDRIP